MRNGFLVEFEHAFHTLNSVVIGVVSEGEAKINFVWGGRATAEPVEADPTVLIVRFKYLADEFNRLSVLVFSILEV